MIPFTLEQLLQSAPAEISGLHESLSHDFQIKNVITSSKESAENSFFIPLKGERFDAHAFIEDALNHDAKVIGSQYDEATLLTLAKTEDVAKLKERLAQITIVKCADTLRLLGLTGQLVRRLSHAKVGAITGSCGKTTTKEMTAAILAECGKTLYTSGNFNNDVGVPLTLLRLEKDHDFAIIEQGASHLQDIARTSEFVEAQFALITNVGKAHIEGFGSSDGVYKGKSEILDKLFALYPPQDNNHSEVGFGIIPADSVWYEQWQKDYASAVEAKKLLSFGESEHATLCVSNIQQKEQVLSFHLHSNDPRFKLDCDISLNVIGRHNAINAAASALLALTMGANEQAVIAGLTASESMSGRLCIEHFSKFDLIDDAYNASFNAVIAAIDTLSSFKGLRVMIFGDMGELGEEAIDLHSKVGSHAKDKIDLLLAVGQLAQYSVKQMEHNAYHFLTHQELLAYIEEIINLQAKSLHPQKVVCLVKGSHAMHMDQIVAALKDFAQQ